MRRPAVGDSGSNLRNGLTYILRVAELLCIPDVAPVNRAVLERAVRSGIDDFEDALIAQSARQVNAQVILTRNERDFARSPIPVHSPISLPALVGPSASPRA